MLPRATTAAGVGARCDSGHPFSTRCRGAPRYMPMAAEKVLPESGSERAALAYSMLSTRCADEVARRLERDRALEAPRRVVTHPVSNVTRSDSPPSTSSPARCARVCSFPCRAHTTRPSCPFRIVESHPRRHVIDVLERVAVREPLQAAVTLCHLSRAMRDELWAQLGVDARSAVISELDAVPGISSARTRIYARDITARLGRAIRNTSGGRRHPSG